MNKRAFCHDGLSEAEDIRETEIWKRVPFRFLEVHGRVAASILKITSRMELEHVEVVKCSI
jgi:hypothetical protein